MNKNIMTVSQDKEVSNIFSALRIMFLLSKIFGYTCFRISKERYDFSKIGVVHPSIIFMLYLGMATFDMFTRGQQDRSEIYHIIELLNVYSFSFNTILIMIFGIYYQRKVLQLLKNISLFEEKMQSFKSPKYLQTSYRNTKISSLVISVVSHSFSVTLLVLDLICFFPKQLVWYQIYKFNFIFTYCVPLYASSSFIAEVNVLLAVITERFRWINEELDKVHKTFKNAYRVSDLTDSYDDYCQSKYLNDSINYLEEVRKVYDILHSITQEFNNIYTVRIMFQVNQIFISLITNILFFLKQYGNKANARKQTTSYLLIILEVMFMNVCQLVSMCFYGTKLCEEASKTALILHEFKVHSNQFDDYIKFFSNQLLHSEVNVVTRNFVSLDISLLFSVIAEATSYLIVCVQLEIPDK